MHIPNFFHYEVKSQGRKIGNIYAPCKWAAKKAWEFCIPTSKFPDVKIKLKGLNIRKKK